MDVPPPGPVAAPEPEGWDVRQKFLEYLADDNTTRFQELLLRPEFHNLILDDGASPLHHISRTPNKITFLTLLLRDRALNVDLNVTEMSAERTPLLEALNAKVFDAATLLINSGANVTLSDTKNCTPLHLAALHNNSDIARLIVRKSDEDLSTLLNARDAAGRTPLHNAIEREDRTIHPHNSSVLQVLVGFGADPTVGLNDSLRTPIHIAARRGYTNDLRLLVDVLRQQGKSVDLELVAVRPHHKKTPLRDAIISGEPEAVHILLEAGADANHVCHADAKSRTALWAAVRKPSVDMVRDLLAHGAIPTKAGDQGYLPLHEACKVGRYPEIASLLLEKHPETAAQPNLRGVRPLHIAAASGCLKIVESLIKDWKVDADCRTSSQQTPFLLAARGGHVPILTYLWRFIRDPIKYPSYRNNGAGALSLACRYGHSTTVAFLLGAGFDPKTEVSDDGTPLHHAAYSGDMATVKLLLDFGADRTKIAHRSIGDRGGVGTPAEVAQFYGWFKVAAAINEYRDGAAEQDDPAQLLRKAYTFIQ